MAFALASLTDLAALPVDAVIDVRSPSEWAEDHLPGAINLPVLDDAERARVGTIYKRESPFRARKVGAALVAANAARHLEGPLAEKPGSWRPLVYCWRGGQRSAAFAAILSQIGWRVEVLAGGYKAWRRLIVAAVHDTPCPAPVIVLDGNTGTAKTEVLARLRVRGIQTIDLEAHAGHRGSVFGATPGGQPSQKAFERTLALDLVALDPARPVLVEAESSRIGALSVPPMLWKAMCAAPRLTLRAPLGARAAYLARAYADLAEDRDALAGTIENLRGFHAAGVIESWHRLVFEGANEALARDLMARHYDPRYGRHRERAGSDEVIAFDLPDLSAGALDCVAEAIAARIEAAAPPRHCRA